MNSKIQEIIEKLFIETELGIDHPKGEFMRDFLQ